ncbi:MAG TPA: NAD-dependent epimerase/dehydratase family protein, partial [Candidatus Dormibacteraeota bacterium]|nr:NAD-dependent epimerase/dehydratase family protein [Candidatus Dormibacteraeota bacterium]
SRAMDWTQQAVLVTGGASFISSHLIDLLVERGARRIRVVDDLSSGQQVGGCLTAMLTER